MTTLDDLARVERELREQFHYYCDDVETASVARHIERAANTIAAYIASAKAASQPEAAPAQNSEAVTTGWRSIETAPNDVSILVAYDDESIELVEAEDNNFKWSGRNPVTQSILGIVNPTHWMPLPETPQANEKEKGDG